MAIYIIGLLDNGSEKIVRLYNDKKNQFRDIKEKDILFMLDEDTIQIKNANIKERKLVGITGSLEKIKNKTAYVVLGYIADTDGKPIAYKFVDSNGKVHIVEIHDCIGFFDKNLVQNASLVDGKFVRGINWEIPCVEKKKKYPKNLDVVSGMGYEVKKAKNLPKDGIILYWDVTGRHSSIMCVDDSLEFSWRSFGLRIPECHFYDVLSELSNIEEEIWVDKENGEYRIIFFYELYNDINKDIEFVKNIVNKLNLKLSLFVDNDIHLSHHPIGLNKCNTLINLWGAGIECNKAGLYFNINNKKYPITFEKGILEPQTDWLGLWNNSVGSLYLRYIRKISKKFGLSFRVGKGYEKVETPTKMELCIRISDDDNKVTITSKEKFKNKLKDNKIVTEFSLAESGPEIVMQGNELNIIYGTDSAYLYVSSNIWNDVLSLLLSESSVLRGGFVINKPYTIKVLYDRDMWPIVLKFMKVLKEKVDFTGYVDICKVVNPLYTIFDNDSKRFKNFKDAFESIDEDEFENDREMEEYKEGLSLFNNYDLIYTGCYFVAKKIIKVFSDFVKLYGFSIIKPKMTELDIGNYDGNIGVEDLKYSEKYLDNYEFGISDISHRYSKIIYIFKKK